MTPLEKFASAVRIAGFGAVASEYIKLSGEDAPEVWDLRSTLEHLGTKLANQAQEEAVVRTGLGALRNVCPGVKTAFNVDFTPEFHAVNSLARSNMKLASHGLEAPLAERRLALWNNMKAAAGVMPDPVAHLTKVAIQVWSETERSGEKTASSREEREAFAVSFAANYLVDQKIAQLNVPATVKAKLASLSAEAAMYDLNKVVKMTEKRAFGTGDNYVSNGHLHLSQGETGYRIGHPDKGHEAPWFWNDLPDVHKKNVKFDSEDMGGRTCWNASISIPTKEAEKHPALKRLMNDDDDAMPKHAFDPYDPRVIGAAIGAVGGAVIGAYDDKDNRLRGGVMGALMGAPLGAAGGHIVHEYGAHATNIAAQAQQAHQAHAANIAAKAQQAHQAYEGLLNAAQMHALNNNVHGPLDVISRSEEAIKQHFLAGNKTLPLHVASAISPANMQALHSALGHLNTRVI